LGEIILKDSADFLHQNYTFAVVMRGTLEQIEHFRKLIIQEDFKVVFQKTSVDKLRIIEGSNNE
jgi:hypothetical protein